MVEKTSNTINIGNIIRKNTKLHVSPKAITEMKSFLEANLEKTTVRLEEIAQSHKRFTIFPEDVIELFGFKDNGVIPNE